MTNSIDTTENEMNLKVVYVLYLGKNSIFFRNTKNVCRINYCFLPLHHQTLKLKEYEQQDITCTIPR